MASILTVVLVVLAIASSGQAAPTGSNADDIFATPDNGNVPVQQEQQSAKNQQAEAEIKDALVKGNEEILRILANAVAGAPSQPSQVPAATADSFLTPSIVASGDEQQAQAPYIHEAPEPVATADHTQDESLDELFPQPAPKSHRRNRKHSAPTEPPAPVAGDSEPYDSPSSGSVDSSFDLSSLLDQSAQQSADPSHDSSSNPADGSALSGSGSYSEAIIAPAPKSSLNSGPGPAAIDGPIDSGLYDFSAPSGSVQSPGIESSGTSGAGTTFDDGVNEPQQEQQPPPSHQSIASEDAALTIEDLKARIRTLEARLRSNQKSTPRHEEQPQSFDVGSSQPAGPHDDDSFLV